MNQRHFALPIHRIFCVTIAFALMLAGSGTVQADKYGYRSGPSYQPPRQNSYQAPRFQPAPKVKLPPAAIPKIPQSQKNPLALPQIQKPGVSQSKIQPRLDNSRAALLRSKLSGVSRLPSAKTPRDRLLGSTNLTPLRKLTFKQRPADTILLHATRLPDKKMDKLKKELASLDEEKNAEKTEGRQKNKLVSDRKAIGDHTIFQRGNDTKVFKYETYERTKTGHMNPVKRFDGGRPDGTPGAPHVNKKTGESVPTPHVQGKDVFGGVRPAELDESPNQ